MAALPVSPGDLDSKGHSNGPEATIALGWGPRAESDLGLVRGFVQ